MRSAFSHLPERKLLGTPSWEPTYRRALTFRDRHHILVDAIWSIAIMFAAIAWAVLVVLVTWRVMEYFGQ